METKDLFQVGLSLFVTWLCAQLLGPHDVSPTSSSVSPALVTRVSLLYIEPVNCTLVLYSVQCTPTW